MASPAKRLLLWHVPLLLLLLLTSCDPCRRAHKVLHRCPAIGTDTLVQLVPHYVPVPGDTLTQWLRFGDTLFVDRDRIRVQVKTDTLTRRIWFRAECKPDTITTEVPRLVITRTIPQRPGFWAQHGQLVALALALALVALLLYQLLNRHR